METQAAPVEEKLEKTYTLVISGVRFVTQVVGTYEGKALLQVMNSPNIFLQLVVEVAQLNALKERLQNEIRDASKDGDQVPPLSETSG